MHISPEVAPAPAPAADNSQLWAHGDRSDIKQKALKQLLERHQRGWTPFREVMGSVLECIHDNDFATRSLAVSALGNALEVMPEQCSEVLVDVFRGLFRAVDDQQSDVSTKAKEVLYTMNRIPAEYVVDAVLTLAESMSDRCLQVTLVGIFPKALAGLPLEEHILKPLQALIHSSIQSEMTDLRKAATWCLVDLYIGAHQTALYLSTGLPPAKIRLLDFYISKRGVNGSLAADLEAFR